MFKKLEFAVSDAFAARIIVGKGGGVKCLKLDLKCGDIPIEFMRSAE
jgi:hypothetical protein